VLEKFFSADNQLSTTYQHRTNTVPTPSIVGLDTVMIRRWVADGPAVGEGKKFST
jgi:hypothetical protein